MKFNLQSDFEPAGDQPQAIETLVNGVEQKFKQCSDGPSSFDEFSIIACKLNQWVVGIGHMGWQEIIGLVVDQHDIWLKTQSGLL